MMMISFTIVNGLLQNAKIASVASVPVERVNDTIQKLERERKLAPIITQTESLLARNHIAFRLHGNTCYAGYCKDKLDFDGCCELSNPSINPSTRVIINTENTNTRDK